MRDGHAAAAIPHTRTGHKGLEIKRAKVKQRRPFGIGRKVDLKPTIDREAVDAIARHTATGTVG
jgi:hypothetical protein